MFAGLSLDRDHDMSSDQVFLGGCLSSDNYYKLSFEHQWDPIGGRVPR